MIYQLLLNSVYVIANILFIFYQSFRLHQPLVHVFALATPNIKLGVVFLNFQGKTLQSVG